MLPHRLGRSGAMTAARINPDGCKLRARRASVGPSARARVLALITIGMALTVDAARAETAGSPPVRVVLQPLNTGDRGADFARIRAVQAWLAKAGVPAVRLLPARTDAAMAASLASQPDGGAARAHLVMVPDTLAAPGRTDLSAAADKIVLLGHMDSPPLLIATQMRFGAVTDLSGQTLAVVPDASPEGAGTRSHAASLLADAGVTAKLEPMALDPAIRAVRAGRIAGLALIGEPARLIAAGLTFRDRVHLLDTRHPGRATGAASRQLTARDGPALIAPGERVHVRTMGTWLAANAAFAGTAVGQNIMAAAQSQGPGDGPAVAAGRTLADLMAEPHVASLNLTAFGGATIAARPGEADTGQTADDRAQPAPSKRPEIDAGPNANAAPAKPKRTRARQVVRGGAAKPVKPVQPAAPNPPQQATSAFSGLQNLLSGTNDTGWNYFKDSQDNRP